MDHTLLLSIIYIKN